MLFSSILSLFDLFELIWRIGSTVTIVREPQNVTVQVRRGQIH